MKETYSYQTISHRLLNNALRTPDKVIFTILGNEDEKEKQYTYQILQNEIQKVVNYFHNQEEKEQKILLMCNTEFEYIYSLFGCLFANVIVIPSKIPESKEEFENIKLVVEDADVKTVVTTSKYEKYITSGLASVGCEIRGLAADGLMAATVDLQECVNQIQEEDIAIIQYTSGTTSKPKGIMISHRNIMDSEKATIIRFGINEHSSVVGWIPIYHSMGLINILIHPIFADVPCVILPPEQFIKKPIRWFEAISKYSATISGGPNFAYDLCLDRISLEDCKNIDLSNWEVAFCGSETIRTDTMHNFIEKFKSLGVRENLMCPCYGLTESTLIVSSSVTNQVPNRATYQDQGVEKTYVSCGPVVDGQILKIVDTEHKCECVQGQAGEIWVSGSVIAKGYYNNEQATREVFKNHLPGDPNDYLATGDIGFLKDNELYVVGRKKNMFVLNGKNYYYEDIEQWIEEMDREKLYGGCIAFADSSDQRIVIVQGIQGGEDTNQYISRIIERFAQKYSIEIADVILIDRNELPKTANGKKQNLLCKERYDQKEFNILGQKQNLVEIQTQGEGSNAFEVFITEIASIMDCADSLTLNQWSQPLYALGINSITSLQIQNHLLAKYGVSLPLLEIRKLSLKELFNQLPARRSEMTQSVTKEESVPETFPLNDLQRAYVLGRNGEYELSKIATHVYFEFESKQLDATQLAQSFEQLVERHAMLRANILDDESQRILGSKEMESPVKELDVSEYSEHDVEILIENTRKNLSHKVYQISEAPYLDLALLQKKESVQICLSIDLLIADARSVFILLDDWRKLYGGEVLTPLHYTFEQYILDDLQSVGSDLYQRADQYWDEKVARIPDFPRLPVKKTKVQEITFHRVNQEVSEELWSKLQQKAMAYEVSLPSILLGAYAQVLSIWSNMDELSINVTNLERKPFHKEVDKLIGQFASFIILDVDLSKKSSFLEQVNAIQNNMWECLDHRQIGGTKILQKLRKQTKQYVEAIMPIVFTCVLEDVQQFEWLGELRHSISQTSQVWLDNQVYVKNGKLFIEWDYVSELFPEGMIEEMSVTYRSLLEKLAVEETAWNQYQMRQLPDQLLEKRRLANATEYTNQMPLVHQEFDLIAKQYPERTALIFEEQKMTYQELRVCSYGIGSLLYQDGACVANNQRVAIIMEKGWEQIVAVLGTLVAGCAYVPIDASLPSERIQFILDDAGIDVVMTQNKLLGQLKWLQDRTIIDVTTKANQPMEEAIEVLPQNQGELAYIIYTSGSTGTPKGVMIRHDGLANAIESTIRKFQITKEDACISITNLHHDMSVFDIFGMLCSGGCVIVPNEWQRKNPADLASMINEHQVTIWNSVPNIIDVYVEYLEYNRELIPQSLKTVFLGGDWIKIKTCEKLFSYIKGLQIVSVGGPTETTLWNIWNPFHQVEQEWTSVPYGKPISNTKYYVLNERLEDCPTWVVGNICSTGVGTTKGYVNDQGTYAMHFANHPLTKEPLFISGDRGRYLPDGSIEFLGREDNQIKINGLRIELGEIEQVLKGQANIEDAKVLRKKIDGEKDILVAYVTSKQKQIDEEQIAALLKKKLPKYMIPTRYIVLDAMPVTRNNKIDILYLENLPLDSESDKPDANSNGVEDDILTQITQIVKDVLKTNRVDPDTELSKLGANSLELIRIINRLERELNYRIGIEEFFANPTIHLLAEFYTRKLRLKHTNKESKASLIEDGSIASIIKGYTVIEKRFDREMFKREQIGMRKFASDRNSIELMMPDVESEYYQRILHRKSHRYFSSEKISFKDFSYLLFHLSNISTGDIPHYIYASGGGSYSVQVYFFIKENRVEGIDQGIYYYHPKKHRLFCITKDGEVTRDIHWTSNKDIFDESAFSVFFISQYDAIGPMYGEQGFDFLRIEAGEMSQVLETYGRECNIGFCQIGNTDFEKVRSLFQLDPSHIYIHAMLGGGLLDEKEENERNTYYVEIEQEMAKGTQSRNVTELQKLVELEDEIEKKLKEGSRKEPSTWTNVLLTGATGFLGSHIIHDVLMDDTTDLYCIVRADSDQQAQDRIIDSLKKWEVTIPEEKVNRIHALAGDVSKDYFGLTKEMYEQLLENIDTVIHNAAWVNWIAKLEELMPINVGGTKRIIEFCATKGIKRLVHVSSLSVFPFDGRKYREDDSLDHGCSLYGGYAQSKWVSEKTVVLAKKWGLPVTIVRPNLITGDRETCVFNQSSFMENLMKSFIQLGYAPDTIADVDMVSVDYVSGVIALVARNEDAIGRVYNVANPNTMTQNDLVEKINRCGYPVKQISFMKWKTKLLNSDDFETNALFPFWTYIYSLEEAQILMGHYACENTLAEDGVTVCDPVDELVDRYMSYFQKIGFIPLPEWEV